MILHIVVLHGMRKQQKRMFCATFVIQTVCQIVGDCLSTMSSSILFGF
jgi:NifU-like protein involved in Fe-S cluster formation